MPCDTQALAKAIIYENERTVDIDKFFSAGSTENTFGKGLNDSITSQNEEIRYPNPIDMLLKNTFSAEKETKKGKKKKRR